MQAHPLSFHLEEYQLKNTMLKTVGYTALATAFVAAAATPAHAAGKVRWKMHSAFPTSQIIQGERAAFVGEAVGKMTGGDFDIKFFEPGALAGGTGYYDGLSQGSFDAAYGTSGYEQGKNTAYAYLSSFPFGPGSDEFYAFFKYGGGEEFAQKLYAADNIHFNLCGMSPPETSGWFKEEITDLDQLKGLKMRFFGVGADVMQKLGVSTQLIAGGDIYPALELGTIDATEYSMPVVDRSAGFYQITKFNYFPGWHQQATTNYFGVAMDKWNDLDDDYKAMVEIACDANIMEHIAQGNSLQHQAMLDNEADGVQIKTWSDDVLRTLQSAWREVHAEKTAENPDVAEFWDLWQAFHNNYKVWGGVGFLAPEFVE